MRKVVSGIGLVVVVVAIKAGVPFLVGYLGLKSPRPNRQDRHVAQYQEITPSHSRAHELFSLLSLMRRKAEESEALPVSCPPELDSLSIEYADYTHQCADAYRKVIAENEDFKHRLQTLYLPRSSRTIQHPVSKKLELVNQGNNRVLAAITEFRWDNAAQLKQENQVAEHALKAELDLALQALLQIHPELGDAETTSPLLVFPGTALF